MKWTLLCQDECFTGRAEKSTAKFIIEFLEHRKFSFTSKQPYVSTGMKTESNAHQFRSFYIYSSHSENAGKPNKVNYLWIPLQATRNQPHVPQETQKWPVIIFPYNYAYRGQIQIVPLQPDIKIYF